MNDTLIALLVSLTGPIWPLLNLKGDFSALSLAAGLAFVGLVALWSRHRRGRRLRLRRFIAFALPRRILLHRSSLLDYRLYVVHTVLFTLAYSWMIVGSEGWRGLTGDALATLFGPGAAAGASPVWSVFAFVTLCQFLAIEFGYWSAHYLAHRVPWLWEFHKVHHSAEVMTPFTEWRQHPIDIFLFANLNALAVGSVYGAIVYALGPQAQPFTLLQTNVVVFGFFLTVHHLRHSHVWMPLTGVLGHLIHSPAHHQLHHSTDPRHHGKNLGYSLSIWDSLFGTLYMPDRREKLTFGIGPEGEEHRSVTATFVLPVRKALAHFRPRAAPSPVKDAETAPTPVA